MRSIGELTKINTSKHKTQVIENITPLSNDSPVKGWQFHVVLEHQLVFMQAKISLFEPEPLPEHQPIRLWTKRPRSDAFPQFEGKGFYKKIAGMIDRR
jgi:hypothetical protein